MVAQEVLTQTIFADAEVHDEPPITSSVKTQQPVEQKPKKKKSFKAGVKDALWVGVFTFVTAFVGAALRGDWLILFVHIYKQWQPDYDVNTKATIQTNDPDKSFFDYFENAHLICLFGVAFSFVTYFGLGGYLQYTYYIKRKDKPEEWKCQPYRWLTPENERHEILLGSFNLITGGTLSGCVTAYILNGGPSCTMYFSALEHGWLYLIGSTVLVFLYQDAGAYYLHRLFHIPFLYKHFHKHHHRYHSPTCFSATAIHPVEFLFYQCVFYIVPIFFVPIYSGSYVFLLFYVYYYGMIDHSGIMMDAVWPWQPESLFHDDHHKYFHTNFGFNTKIWDWLHDTYRLESRVYGEDVFYGKGKSDEKTQ